MRTSTLTSLAVAGWLFADVMLAFSVLVLASGPAPARTIPSPSPRSSPTPTVNGLERRPVVVNLTLGPGDVAKRRSTAIDKIRKVLARSPELRGQRAGMVLTFGANHHSAGDGEQFAHDVNILLPAASPQLFGDATTRTFHSLSNDDGWVELDIYLFTTS